MRTPEIEAFLYDAEVSVRAENAVYNSPWGTVKELREAFKSGSFTNKAGVGRKTLLELREVLLPEPKTVTITLAAYKDAAIYIENLRCAGLNVPARVYQIFLGDEQGE